METLIRPPQVINSFNITTIPTRVDSGELAFPPHIPRKSLSSNPIHSIFDANDEILSTVQ